MVMCIGLQLEPPTRRQLLLEMELVGEQFESVLVGAEALLRCAEYRRAMGVVSGSYDRRAEGGRAYRSIIDFLIALASPGWDWVIQDFHEGRGRPLIRYAEQDTVAALDLAVVHFLEELRALRETYDEAGWVEGASTPEYEQLIEAGIRLFITPHFPSAVPDPECRRFEAADEQHLTLASGGARAPQENP